MPLSLQSCDAANPAQALTKLEKWTIDIIIKKENYSIYTLKFVNVVWRCRFLALRDVKSCSDYMKPLFNMCKVNLAFILTIILKLKS